MKLEKITEGLTQLLLDNHYTPTTIHFYEREWKKIHMPSISKSAGIPCTVCLLLFVLAYTIKSKVCERMENHMEYISVSEAAKKWGYQSGGYRNFAGKPHTECCKV